MTQTVEGARSQAQAYYGQTLQGSADLKTGACCDSEAIPLYQRELLTNIQPEILERFYGCGSPLPPALAGQTVLDLGCGTGRDVYLAAQLVGAEGRVIGLDMTEEQLAVARRHESDQMKRFGYVVPNTRFLHGFIEDLSAAGIEDNSVDVVISNCVINLSADKDAVFREIFRVLRPGGELFFADVFASRRVPAELSLDMVLHGECLAGAMYTEDFRRSMQRHGCLDHRVLSSRTIEILDSALRNRLGPIEFSSRLVRGFALSSLEDTCEDYGQVAIYKGTLPEAPHGFELDDHHYFESQRPMLVCGNTASMLSETRYSPHFEVMGDRSRHFGLFDCGVPGDSARESGSPCCS